MHVKVVLGSTLNPGIDFLGDSLSLSHRDFHVLEFYSLMRNAMRRQSELIEVLWEGS